MNYFRLFQYNRLSLIHQQQKQGTATRNLNGDQKMTNSNNFAETTIVAFHIGRGGHFNNSGHLSFIGAEKISKYTGDLFLTFENACEVGEKIQDRENLRSKFEQALDGNTDAISFFERLKLPLGEIIYMDCNGAPVGLSEKEAETGIGCINIDNDYNTTYACHLSNCNEKELRLIAEFHGYVDSNIRDYAKEQLGIVDEEETQY